MHPFSAAGQVPAPHLDAVQKQGEIHAVEMVCVNLEAQDAVRSVLNTGGYLQEGISKLMVCCVASITQASVKMV
jgi:hypothetical protein